MAYSLAGEKAAAVTRESGEVAACSLEREGRRRQSLAFGMGQKENSKTVAKRLRLRVSVVPTHLISVRLLLDIAKKILRQILNWNSPLKICALHIRIIRTMGQGQSERNIEIALTACLWRSSIQLILENFAAKSGRVGGCAANTYLKPVSLHSGRRYVPVLAISAAVSIATRVACL